MVYRTVWLLLLVPAFSVAAQGVARIDLRATPQRTELRSPPRPQNRNFFGAGGGGGSVVEGAADDRDPRSLSVSLEINAPDGIDPALPFDVEFKLLNTGRVDLEIPVHPHLSDLQPADPAEEFKYMSLSLAINLQGSADPPACVRLYGAAGHDESIRRLSPGEWILVDANIKLPSSPAETSATTLHLQPRYWLSHETYTAHADGTFLRGTSNLVSNEIRPAPIEVMLRRPPAKSPEQPAPAH